ncbi:MAG: flagellar hook-basal body complex protein FliE [Thermodesulfobacteriota bacterium]
MDEISARVIHGPDMGSGVERQARSAGGEGDVTFQKVFQEALEEVNSLQHQANQAIKELAVGNGQDLHKTMIMLEKADLSFRLMMQVRNKLLDAYQEIMRMPL